MDDEMTTHRANPALLASDGWRIDDLARRAGLTVDTIRYYQREGLLCPAVRTGRTNLYFGEHLERLERIKELQQRRFSLAAIRALLDDERRDLLESVFAGRNERTFTFDELVERGGVDARFAAALRDAGVLRSTAAPGHDAYDGDDLDLLCAMAELCRLGIPSAAVVDVARAYADGIEATQRSVSELIAPGSTLGWSDSQVREVRQVIERSSRVMLPIARRIIDYTFCRVTQRLVLDAIEQGATEPLEREQPRAKTEENGPPKR